MSYRREVLLAAASTCLGLALCEGGLRWRGWNGAPIPLARAAGAAEKPRDLAVLRPYLDRLPAAPGTDRRWLLETPSPLPNRSKPDPRMVARYADFERRGLFAPQAEFLFNPAYIAIRQCLPDWIFRGYPATVLTFHPPGGNRYPRYRFPPNSTLVSGLVTNAFGLRGHPIALAKPARTIRIAFLGASTTVDQHDFAFSYPELVEYWLNRFAAAQGRDVRFEALNAGREGLGSADIAAILQDELLPLDPDLAVYYEGANQFDFRPLLVPAIAARTQLDARDSAVTSRLPALLLRHSVLANLVDRVLLGAYTAGEPRKPGYQLAWPAGLDEQHPDPFTGLPLDLTNIVRDLDTMRTEMQSVGGQLLVCSFVRLAPDGVPLSPVRHRNLYQQLNTTLWPLRYRDLRRLATFQNRVFRAYAEARSLPFLDVAAAVPQEPDLFDDSVHMTEAGCRIKAWAVFQQLLPVLRRKMASSELPRAAGDRPVARPPDLTAAEFALPCR